MNATERHPPPCGVLYVTSLIFTFAHILGGSGESRWRSKVIVVSTIWGESSDRFYKLEGGGWRRCKSRDLSRESYYHLVPTQYYYYIIYMLSLNYHLTITFYLPMQSFFKNNIHQKSKEGDLWNE